MLNSVKRFDMCAILILDPKPVFRLGLTQLLSTMYPSATIHSDTPCPTKHKTPTQNYDLILLSLLTDSTYPHQLSHFTHLYEPRFILLLNEPNSQPLSPLSLCQQFPAVCGLISKESSAELILAAVNLVLSGGACFPHSQGTHDELQLNFYTPTTPLPLPQPTPPPENWFFIQQKECQLLGLTPRQYEVLVLLSQGHPLKTIAKLLNISVATTKTHTETLYQRLNVHNRNAAVYAAISKGATLGWPDSSLTLPQQ